MSKVAVVFWSGTGNTEMMAGFVCNGAKSNGADIQLFTATEFNAEMMDNFDAIAFGCSAMGAEVLEENEFEPMFSECETKLNGKKIALFGSYGWGDGEWMRNWEERCISAGAIFACDYVICNEAPDNVAEMACIELGKAL